MKILFTIALLLITIEGFTQFKTDYSKLYIEELYKSSSKIKSFSPNETFFDDLESVGNAIGDKRIVFLGEPSHGDGGAILMKTRLVKYLHEKKGFDVLLFENDLCSIFFDMADLQDTSQIRTKAQENILTCWSKSKVSQELWTYYNQQLVGKNKITIGGIDPRHSGKFAKTKMLNLLTNILEKTSYNINSNSYKLFLKDMNYIFKNQFDSKKDSVNAENFFSEIAKIEETIKFSNTNIEKRNEWLLETTNLKNCFNFIINDKCRDIIMAENVAYFHKHIYPNKKIMVWSHNNHNVLDVNVFASFDAEFAKLWHEKNTYNFFTYLGTDVFREFKDDVYSLAITSGSGNFSPNFMEKYYFVDNFTTAKVPQSTEKSLEYYLQSKKCNIVFIPFPNIQGRPSGYPWFASRLMDLSFELLLDYTSAFSGCIYIDKTVDLNGQ